LPDAGIYNRGAFSFPFFTYLSLEMLASAPIASAPIASAPVASAPVTSGPVPSGPVPSGPVPSGPIIDAKKEKIISDLRELFCKFKTPYLEERDGDDENSSIQNVDEVEESAKHIDKLFMIVSAFIEARGAPPTTTDGSVTSIYKVFEPLMKELRANPSLYEEMMHYTKLDLRTYPFTLSARHINHLERDGIQSLKRIVPNTLINTQEEE
jgi:hypothetical protein